MTLAILQQLTILAIKHTTIQNDQAATVVSKTFQMMNAQGEVEQLQKIGKTLIIVRK